MSNTPLPKDETSDEPVELVLDIDEAKKTEKADAAKETSRPAVEQPEEAPSEEELRGLELSEIESSEATPTAEVEESVDPDKEATPVKVVPVVPKPWWKRPIFIIPIVLAVLAIGSLALPSVRYSTIGSLWRQDVTITVADAATRTAVTDAVVHIGNQTATTNSLGQATVTGVAAGIHTIKVEKSNYNSFTQQLTIEVLATNIRPDVTLKATGRPVQVTVTNRLTGQAVADAAIGKSGTVYGRTDSKGAATVILPADTDTIDIAVTADKYVSLQTKLTLTTKDLQLVPEGMIYFLSKQSGKIDVVKSNLDGTGRKTVIAGTGNEDSGNTVLLASRDWKYLMLKSVRLPNKPANLYLIDTSTDNMTTIDEGNATFTPIGWSGHRLLYEVNRNNLDYYKAKKQAVKSFDAASSKLATLDENLNAANGQAVETFDGYYIVDGALMYTKTWSSQFTSVYSSIQDKQSTIVSVNPDGSGRRTIKGFAAAAAISSHLSEPKEMYYRISIPTLYNGIPQYESPPKETFAEVDDGVYKEIKAIANFDTNEYPTYLLSPDGKSVFWSESRDGKNALFTGDENAENKQQLVAGSEYRSYGWLGNTLLLLQKNNSELYVADKEALKSGSQPLKISDYHKPNQNFYGYGAGYGGQ